MRRDLQRKLYKLPLTCIQRANIVSAYEGIKGGMIYLLDSPSTLKTLITEVFPELGLHFRLKRSRGNCFKLFFTRFHEEFSRRLLWPGKDGIIARGEFYHYPSCCIKKFLKPGRSKRRKYAPYFAFTFHAPCGLRCDESHYLDLRIDQATTREMGTGLRFGVIVDRLSNQFRYRFDVVKRTISSYGFGGKLSCERRIYKTKNSKIKFYQHDVWRLGRFVYECFKDMTGRNIYDEVRIEQRIPQIAEAITYKVLRV
jgi:hypothetical protein